MKNRNRFYWQQIAEELEEVVSDEAIENHYDEDKIPDLEELASQCPYDDLSEMLLRNARMIECHLGEREELVGGLGENYLELCFNS